MRSVAGTELSREQYLKHIKADYALMVESLAGPAVQVPSCPDWDTDALAEHMGMVYLHQAYVVETSNLPENEAHLAAVSGFTDPHKLLAAGYEAIIRALDPTREERKTWSWHHSDFSVDFWFRRMAHETVIHRADAQIARGQAPQIEDALALDGVDEVLDFLPLLGSWPEAPNVKFGIVSIVVPTDSGEQVWDVEFTDHSTTITSAAKPNPDARLKISGDAEAMDLYLWGRITSADPRINIVGDDEATFKKLMQVAVL
jgi:uncharacterized protein (TIGR03083 family)